MRKDVVRSAACQLSAPNWSFNVVLDCPESCHFKEVNAQGEVVQTVYKLVAFS
jgi:hypothetical protein